MTPPQYASFSDMSREVARQFLRTVVIVDDQAEFGPAEDGVDTNAANAQPAPQAGRRRGQPPVVVEPQREALEAARRSVPNRLDAKAITDAFAKKGLVTAVLKPMPNEDASAEADPIAAQSDVLVLDWDIHKDFGKSATDLLDSILKADETGARFRLVAIYTGDRQLNQIVDALKKLLEKHYPKHQLRLPDAFTIWKGPVRVVVLAKEGTEFIPQDTVARKQMTAHADLPDRLIAEFSSLARGLVSNVALASLAAVRANTFNIITKLHSGLDPAYLWQRATQNDPAEAEGHLIELTAAEVKSVLDEEGVGRWAAIAAIKLWLEENCPNDDWKKRFGDQRDPKLADVYALLTEGLQARKVDFPWLDRTPPKSMVAFAKSIAEADRSNEEFAVLMLVKSWYSKPARYLTLGTVLQSARERKKEFWLCMQPRCDSVRLSGAVAFPLVPLEENNSRFDIILPDGKGGHYRLKSSRQPSRIEMVKFQTTTNSDCVEAEMELEQYVFRAANRKRFYWLGELKPGQAQSLALELANQFSRVGLTESEWLRRSGH